jgi:DNA-binding NtrC family response regulator
MSTLDNIPMHKIDTPRILITDPDPTCRESYAEMLAQCSHDITTVAAGETALELISDGSFDVVISDLELSDMEGMEFLRKAHAVQEDLSVIMMAAFGSVEDAVEAMRLGASDFLSKPFSNEQLKVAVDNATRTHRLLVENQDLKEALDDRLRLDNVIATDEAMLGILKSVKSVAPTKTTVLITGESGTGKTLLARSIHQHSPRADGPFIEVNCGALPESLLESELFGHMRGAFTGAVKDRAGKFEAANRGTIFLDEIGNSSLAFQIKLLRVLQDRVIERLGGTDPIDVDVRIILATNIDLEQAVADGTFREDLFYRIQVIALEMPPLRDRRSDIANLAKVFLRRYAAEIGKPIDGFSTTAMQMLVNAPWPGNVRQLENVIERAVVLTEHQQVLAEDLPETLTPARLNTVVTNSSAGLGIPAQAHLLPLKEGLEGPEKALIKRALEHHNCNRKKTAESLDINRSTLFNKMRKYDLL